MSQHFVTADTHFFHRNIIRHCERPFGNVTHMTERLIANWNKVVGPADHVWHLGDFFWGKKLSMAMEVRGELNGIIHVTPGNHDDKRFLRALGLDITDDIVLMREGQDSVLMCHYPFEDWYGREHGYIHLHGHSHGRSRPAHNRLDCGTDCTEFHPIPLSVAIAKAKKVALEPLVDPLECERARI